jgi:hypothetical protein
MGKTIGIKLADSTFYPIVSTDSLGTKELGLTTVQENQGEVHVDLYRGDEEDSRTVEYLDTLRLDHLLPHPAGDADIALTLILDEDDFFVADLFDPESGERNVKTIPRVTSRSAGFVQPVYDLFGAMERGQDLLDSVEDIDDTGSEVGGDEATEEIGLPFDEIADIVDMVDMDDEVTAGVESLESIEPAGKTGDDFDFGARISKGSQSEAKPIPPDAVAKRVRFISIAVVIIFIEVLVACFIIVRPRLVSNADKNLKGDYIVSTQTSPSLCS